MPLFGRTLFLLFLQRVWTEWKWLAMIKRHVATAAPVRSTCLSLCLYLKLHEWASSSVSLSSSAVSVFLTVLNVHDASSVIAFGTSAPCHFSATNVTELWPKPYILYSASSLIWLQRYHIWVDLITSSVALPPSVCPCKVCERVLLAQLLAGTHVHIHAPWCMCVCVGVHNVRVCMWNKLQSSWQANELNESRIHAACAATSAAWGSDQVLWHDSHWNNVSTVLPEGCTSRNISVTNSMPPRRSSFLETFALITWPHDD